MKSLIFKNDRVGEIDLVNDEGVRLVTLEGVSAEANVNLQTVAGYDGATEQSAAMPERYITVNFRIRKQANAEAAMSNLYRIFAAKSKGTMHFRSRESSNKIDYIVQQCSIPPNNKDLTGTAILVCTDPYFRAERDSITTLAGTQSRFMFPFTFPSHPFYISQRMASLFADVVNDGDADTDITITIEARGTVVNPYIQLVDTREKSTIRLTLHRDDKVVITTRTDGKSVYLYREGTTNNIFNYLTFPFTFFKLAQGSNIFTYGADSGRDNMDIKISYAARYGALYSGNAEADT